MKYRLLLFLLFVNLPNLFAQEWIEGKVLDASTDQPLAFVNIIFPQSGGGVNTDIDGSFRFQASPYRQKVVFSYLGYKRDTLSLEEVQENPTIQLKPNAYKISEVTILPGVNPAHRIIEAAIANKEQNNPEKATEFSYDSYNKLVFTGTPDSAYASLPDSIQRMDSSSYEGIEFLAQSHLFLIESVTERNHIPPTHTKEVVKASRVSGLKTPFFTLIGTQLQSFSLYNDYVKLLGKAYLSPISKGSTSKYLFVLEDTLYQGGDSIFSISYRPRKGKFFDGLQGVLTINSDGYAVQNFIAHSSDQEGVNVKIQQQYKKVGDQQWFPIQLNTTLTFTDLDVPDFIFYAEGKSYLKNIELESKLDKKALGNVVLEMEDEAGKKDSSYWEYYREKPLDSLEMETYRLVDSLGNEAKLDQKMQGLLALVRGAIPIGPVDLLLKRLMDYNSYEGFRLGLGAETNDKISKHFRLGGYGAYGFQDKAWKYGGHLKWNSLWDNHLSMKLTYERDVVESGGVSFYNDWINPFSSETFHKLFIQRMDSVEKYEVEIETHPLRDFQLTFFGNVQNRGITSAYRFNPEKTETDEGIDQFRLVESGVNIRYAFREKFVEMFGVKTPISYEYPIVYLKYSRGFNDLLEGDYSYNRLDLKVHKNFRLRHLGYTSLRLTGGFIDRQLPLTALFRARGSYLPSFAFASDYSFQTLRPNEFFNDQYAALFFKHTFKNLLFESKLFKPELALVASAGYGKMHQIESHQEVDFKSMESGLFESGIQLDCLFGIVDWGFEQIGMEGTNFGSFGVGVFFRHGPYSEKVFWDNAVVKGTYAVKF